MDIKHQEIQIDFIFKRMAHISKSKRFYMLVLVKLTNIQVAKYTQTMFHVPLTPKQWIPSLGKYTCMSLEKHMVGNYS